MSDRLVLGVADAPDEQVHQLRAQDESMEGQRPEALFHGPLLTGRLVWVQVGVGGMPASHHSPDEGLGLEKSGTLKATAHLLSNICCNRSTPSSGGSTAEVWSSQTFLSSLDG